MLPLFSVSTPSTPPRRRSLRAALLLTMVACAGCVPSAVPGEVAAILEKPDDFEIFAIAPREIRPDDPHDPPLPAFHRHEIQGSAKIAGARERAKLVSLLYKGIRSSDDVMAACFNPRHGVRATRDGRTVDLVICFECLQEEVYGPDGKRKVVMTSSNVAADFNAIFQAAGLHVAP